MDLSRGPLWHVGAGDTDRAYGELCPRHDVIIAEPGHLGPFDEQRYSDLVTHRVREPEE